MKAFTALVQRKVISFINHKMVKKGMTIDNIKFLKNPIEFTQFTIL